jgi:hypothetical protein
VNTPKIRILSQFNGNNVIYTSHLGQDPTIESAKTF